MVVSLTKVKARLLGLDFQSSHRPPAFESHNCCEKRHCQKTRKSRFNMGEDHQECLRKQFEKDCRRVGQSSFLAFKKLIHFVIFSVHKFCKFIRSKKKLGADSEDGSIVYCIREQTLSSFNFSATEALKFFEEPFTIPKKTEQITPFNHYIF